MSQLFSLVLLGCSQFPKWATVFLIYSVNLCLLLPLSGTLFFVFYLVHPCYFLRFHLKKKQSIFFCTEKPTLSLQKQISYSFSVFQCMIFLIFYWGTIIYNKMYPFYVISLVLKNQYIQVTILVIKIWNISITPQNSLVALSR